MLSNASFFIQDNSVRQFLGADQLLFMVPLVSKVLVKTKKTILWAPVDGIINMLVLSLLSLHFIYSIMFSSLLHVKGLLWCNRIEYIYTTVSLHFPLQLQTSDQVIFLHYNRAFMIWRYRSSLRIKALILDRLSMLIMTLLPQTPLVEKAGTPVDSPHSGSCVVFQELMTISLWCHLFLPRPKTNPSITFQR